MSEKIHTTASTWWHASILLVNYQAYSCCNSFNVKLRWLGSSMYPASNELYIAKIMYLELSVITYINNSSQSFRTSILTSEPEWKTVNYLTGKCRKSLTEKLYALLLRLWPMLQVFHHLQRILTICGWHHSNALVAGFAASHQRALIISVVILPLQNNTCHIKALMIIVVILPG